MFPREPDRLGVSFRVGIDACSSDFLVPTPCIPLPKPDPFGQTNTGNETENGSFDVGLERFGSAEFRNGASGVSNECKSPSKGVTGQGVMCKPRGADVVGRLRFGLAIVYLWSVIVFAVYCSFENLM